MSATEKAMTS